MADATQGRADEEIKRRLIERLDALNTEDKQKVLDFSEHLAARRSSEAREPGPVTGTGGALLAFAGTIPADDLEIMRRAIEEDCEVVDEEAW